MWHGHDTGDVVLLQAVLLLAEVTHQVTPVLVVVGKHVKEEWFDIVVESLVVQEELDQETEVLAINFVCVAVHLKDTEVVLPVDLHPWWMSPWTLRHVPVKD